MKRNKEKYTNDAALMGAVALGRHDALNEILDRYMSVVSRVSYRILCDRHDSEDITREVFVRVWAKASDFDGRYNLTTWMHRITCKLCCRRLRRHKIKSFFWITTSVFETSAPSALSPEEDFITKETWEIFCRASRYLSSGQRIVFTLCDLEGLDMEEVQAVTGMASGQIENSLLAARNKIRQELQRYGKVR